MSEYGGLEPVLKALKIADTHHSARPEAGARSQDPRKVDIRLPGKGNLWRKASPPNHLADKVDSDQEVAYK